MAISFRAAAAAGLEPLTAEVPDAAIVGVTGSASQGLDALAALAAGKAAPVSGEVRVETAAVHVHPYAGLDEAERIGLRLELERQRRQGATVLVIAHDLDLLATMCDEVWWIDGGRLAARGAPGEVLAAYRKSVAARVSEQWTRAGQPLAPSLRRGDGRARVESIEILDAQDRPAMVLPSGDIASVRVKVRFAEAVEDPVAGIMIRTRIGFEVYGTNTELERLKLGPVQAGSLLTVRFRFRCDLCPQEYTITAASHDPDGTWHDWLEDAVAFSVSDSRYTAGVANLRAEVTVES